MAHEVFHIYNVKRIRARALGPFDYTKENYTTLLWVMEGVTVYYSGRILLKVGLLSPERYQRNISSLMNTVSNNKGDRYQSAAEASFDAWIRYYRRNESSPNRDVDYYVKGNLLGLLLDLEIRYSSKNKNSLDDVMRRLYTEYYKKKKRGFSEEEFKRVVERAAGKKLDYFFENYVYGTEEIDYKKYLYYAGLEVEDLSASSISESRAYLGIITRERAGRLMITRVVRDSPAWNYGLNVNDEIIALNGLRVNKSEFLSAAGRLTPGDLMTLTVARGDWLREIEVVLGKPTDKNYFLFRTKEPTELQKAIYESYFMTEWAGDEVKN